MGLVLWIDQNTFATGLLEKVFKTKGLELYTLEKAADFGYLVEDLRPQVLVLDTLTAEESLEAFKAQYESSELLQKMPVVLVGETDRLSFLVNVIGKISRPFDPFYIPEKLQQILSSN